MEEHPHPRAPRQATWRMLGEFTLHASPGGDRRAGERVARMARELSVPPEFVERIRAAVAQATLNVIGRDADQRPAATVGIRMLISTEPLPEGSKGVQRILLWEVSR